MMVPDIAPEAHSGLAEEGASLGSDSLQPPEGGGATHCPCAEQLSPASHSPHCLPQPSSPHCLLLQSGVHTLGSPPELPPMSLPPELPPPPVPPPAPPVGSAPPVSPPGVSSAPPLAAMKGSIHA